MHLDHKRHTVFYGWWIVGASALIALYGGGVVFYGFTTIFELIADNLGWSYAQISLAASIRGLESGLLAPLVGVLVDRLGPRRLIFGGAIVTAAGLFLLSRTTSLGMFYGAFALIAIGMSTCTGTVLMTAVANWFQKNIGLASGIAISGYGFSGLLVLVMVWLINLYEWRMTITILAAGMLVTVLPLSLLFRHKPEQYGYLTDGRVGAPVIPDNGLALSPTVEVTVKVQQALKSSTLWHIALPFACHMMLVNATVIHVMPYLSSIGFARSVSGLVASGIPLMSIGGRLSLGWLGDKTNRRRVSAVAFAMTGLGLFFFGYASSTGTWLLVLFLVLFGIGYGGANAMRPSLAREYFGRANFGTLFGIIMGISTMGSIIGPPVAGWVYDNWGNYQGIWLIFASLSIAAIISILTIPPLRTEAKSPDKG